MYFLLPFLCLRLNHISHVNISGGMTSDSSNIIDLNVGGVLYTTSLETLTKVTEIALQK